MQAHADVVPYDGPSRIEEQEEEAKTESDRVTPASKMKMKLPQLRVTRIAFICLVNMNHLTYPVRKINFKIQKEKNVLCKYK